MANLSNKLHQHKINYTRKLKKALMHLSYSYQKILLLPTNPEVLDDETLETWEGFSARFARVVDLFITRYLRTLILIEDPGFNGTVRDILFFAEKKHWIEKAEDWLAVRELRNISAHDYTEKELGDFFQKIKHHTPQLLQLVEKL